MFTYLKFEREVIRKSFQKLTLLAILAIIGTLFLINRQKATEEVQNFEKLYHFTQEDFDRNMDIGSLESYLKQELTEEEYNRDKKMAYQFSDTRLKIFSSIVNKDYQAYYRYQLENLETFAIDELLNVNQGTEIFYDSPFVFMQYADGQNKLYNQLLKRRLKLETPRYGISNWLFTLSSLKYITSIIGGFFFLIVCGFIHFGKYEEQQSKMLMTLPINKTSILLGDTILFFFHSMLMLSFMLIFCYLFGYIFGEVVPFDYPIIVRNADKIVLIPVYKVVLYLCFLFLLVLNAMFQLSVTAMFLVKKTFLAIFVSSLCVLLISIFFQRTTIIGEVFSSYNPFTYTSPFDLFVGISNEVIDTVQANASSLTYNNVDYYSGLTLVALNKNIDVFKGGISLFMTFSGLFIINNFLIKRTKF